MAQHHRSSSPNRSSSRSKTADSAPTPSCHHHSSGGKPLIHDTLAIDKERPTLSPSRSQRETPSSRPSLDLTASSPAIADDSQISSPALSPVPPSLKSSRAEDHVRSILRVSSTSHPRPSQQTTNAGKRASTVAIPLCRPLLTTLNLLKPALTSAWTPSCKLMLATDTATRLTMKHQ